MVFIGRCELAKFISLTFFFFILVIFVGFGFVLRESEETLKFEARYHYGHKFTGYVVVAILVYHLLCLSI